MSKSLNDVILFYAEYTGKNGTRHYAVHKYHPVSGIIDMMRDFKDDCFSYDAAVKDMKKYDNEQNENPRYKLVETSGKIFVVDANADNKTIAVFYDRRLASEYCEQMNLDDKYADKLEDDPWL